MTWADQPAYKWQISQSKARLKERANKFAKLVSDWFLADLHIYDFVNICKDM